MSCRAVLTQVANYGDDALKLMIDLATNNHTVRQYKKSLQNKLQPYKLISLYTTLHKKPWPTLN